MPEIYRTLLRNYYVKKVQQYTVFGVMRGGDVRLFHAHTHDGAQRPPQRFFISEFWVSCRILVLFGLIRPDVLRKN